MRYTSWGDYELLDASCGERLECWGGVVLVRPDPQIIWNTPKIHAAWRHPHAKYTRSRSGGGSWEVFKKIPENWRVSYENLVFNLKLMNFKHTGVFPEQAANWDLMRKIIKDSPKKTNVLNLFAYTGGATLACAAAGASVCHVDASRGMVERARENAEGSGLKNAPIRWIVEDCTKFVRREISRGRTYDGIIMDPPSYGRGPKGEIWQLEDELYDFVKLSADLLTKDSSFLFLNSYSTGLSPSVCGYILEYILKNHLGGKVVSGEIGIPVASSGLVLPAGATSVWVADSAAKALEKEQWLRFA